MNDELNHEVASKTVALTFRAARLTKETLEKALKKYLESREHKLRNLINENKNADYLLWNGNRVQIKRAKFEKYVDSLEAI